MVRRLGMAYFGGAVGALVASLVLWIAARAAFTTALGVAVAEDLDAERLQTRILWGGIWGLGYPWVLRRGLTPLRSGLLWSLAPSIVELFYLLPRAGYGMLGVELGALTPVVVLVANGIWGWTLSRVALAGGEARPAKAKAKAD
jgi:hypothetical protein